MIKNPILKGFCPDPSIVRAGEKYYIATSTFEWWPGVRLFESTDLKNWKQIASVLTRKSQLDLLGDPSSGGVWAPCLSYDGERFFVVYTDVKTKKGRFYNTNNYVVWTDDIYGKWSEPVYFNSIGFDPSLFHDTDGKKYLVNMINGFKGITVQEVDAYSMKALNERRMVYKGSGIGCLEGPHIYHIGDWYYLIAAEGGTGYDHCVTMARADNVYGPYETCPDNPVLTSDREGLLQKCGHADIVETPEHEWYMVHLCSRPIENVNGCILGRETAIQAITLDEDGWFRTVNESGYGVEEVEEPKGEYAIGENDSIDFTDEFDRGCIDVRYSSLRWDYNEFAYVDKQKNRLILRGEESLNSLHHVSLLATRQQSRNCKAQTCMSFEPEAYQHLAGITYMYDNMNFYILGKTKNEQGDSIVVVMKSDKGEISDMAIQVINDDKPIELSIETDGVDIYFSYAIDGKWTKMDAIGSTAILTDEYCRGFTGAHFGMYIHDMLEKKAVAEYDYWSIKSDSV